MSNPDAADSAAVTAAIRETLKGPVLGTLRELVPSLSDHPQATAYDHAIGNLDLLEECFRTFRDQRQHFHHVLLDSSGRPIADDAAPLACGRSLDEVVAMVVRTAARRYFRSHFGKGKSAAPAAAKPPRNEGDELYDVLKQHLQFEWQVPMVPDYCQLKLSEAKTLGEKILDLKDRALLSSALSGLRGGLRQATAHRPPPAALSGGGDREAKLVAVPDDKRTERQRINLIGNYLTIDGKRLRGASFIEAMAQADVRPLLPSHNAVTQFTSILDRVGAGAVTMLVDQLNLRADQLVVLLLKTHACIGAENFFRLFGIGADAKLTARLVTHAKMAGIDTPTPVKDVARFVAIAFARMTSPGERNTAS